MSRGCEAGLLLATLALTACAGGATRREGDGSLAFIGVKVVSPDSERVVGDQTVVVAGTRIAAVGPAGQVPVPQGAKRIDGAGRYLVPGLADMHVHADDDRDLAVFVAYGVTTVRNLAGGPEHLDRRERIARGELVGPLMYTAGPVIDGPLDPWPGNVHPPVPREAIEIVETREDGMRVVREQAAAGYDFIKVYDNLGGEAFAGVAAAARELGIPVVGHVPFGAGLTACLESRIASIEHLRGYVYELLDPRSGFSLGWDKRTRFLAWNHVDPSRVGRLVAATVDAGVWNVPTLVRYQKNMLPREAHLSRYTSDAARYVDPAGVERMLGARARGGRYGAFTASEIDGGGSVFEAQKAFVSALHEAGAGLLLGSDDLLQGFGTHQELENLVSAGLTPVEAIATGTVNAAAFLGEADEFGLVQAGMRADLILVEGDPSRDVRRLRAPAGVVLRGRWLPRDELRRMLDEVAASYAAERSAPRPPRADGPAG